MDIHAIRPRSRAFTLIELMIILAALMITLSIGLPSLRSLQGHNSLVAASNRLVGQLQFARSEAVKRGYPVVLCPASQPDRCSPGDEWQDGLLIFADNNHNRRLDAGEQVLHHYRPDPGTRLVTSRWRRILVFRPDGSAPGSTATITLCDPARAAAPRAVILSNPGRPRVSRTRPDGSPLLCG